MKSSALGIVGLTALLLAGCSGPPQPAPPASPIPTAGATVSSTALSVSASGTPTQDVSGPPVSVRGNLIKHVGETSVVNTPKSFKPMANITVRAIDVDPGCTVPSPRPPENGHFVVLTIDLEAAPGLVEDGDKKWGMYSTGWKVIAANGTTQNGRPQTTASILCLDDSEELPNEIGLGEKATGKVVLDVASPSGTVVYSDPGWPSGLEWEYPAK